MPEPRRVDRLCLVDENSEVLESVDVADIELWTGTLPSAESRRRLIAALDEIVAAFGLRIVVTADARSRDRQDGWLT